MLKEIRNEQYQNRLKCKEEKKRERMFEWEFHEHATNTRDVSVDKLSELSPWDRFHSRKINFKGDSSDLRVKMSSFFWNKFYSFIPLKESHLKL